MKKIDDNQKKLIMELYQTKTAKEVAQILNIKHQTVIKIIQISQMSEPELEEFRKRRREICKKYRSQNKEKQHDYYLKVQKPKRPKTRKTPTLEEQRSRKRQYYKKKMQEDFQFKTGVYTRNRVRKLLKAKKKGSISTAELLGCDKETLKAHLEAKFSDGMNWDNYGLGKDKWSIDHIVPMSKFNLADPDELKRACHYTNLQPMWCSDNFRKGNRV